MVIIFNHKDILEFCLPSPNLIQWDLIVERQEILPDNHILYLYFKDRKAKIKQRLITELIDFELDYYTYKTTLVKENKKYDTICFKIYLSSQ